MIRVVLADDHEVVRVGLRSALEIAGDIDVVAEASTGFETIAAVKRERPDVLLLDIQMPGGDGLFVLAELTRESLGVATLVLTTFDSPDQEIEAIRLGARGYLLKNVKLPRLFETVRALAAGGTSLGHGLSDANLRELQAVQQGATAPTYRTPEPLTSREREILRLLASGFSNRELARALHVAEGTAKNHVSSILSKLGARDRTRAVLLAAELGYLAR